MDKKYTSTQRHPYLVHGEVSVVEVAAASLEANFRHTVVNQEKIPQLRNTKRSMSEKFGGKFDDECSTDANTTYISHLLVRIHRDSVGFSLAWMLTATPGDTTRARTGNSLDSNRS